VKIIKINAFLHLPPARLPVSTALPEHETLKESPTDHHQYFLDHDPPTSETKINH